MAKIEFKSMGFGRSTCNGPMYIKLNGKEARILGNIHPLLPAVIGTNIHVIVEPDASGPVFIENPETHREAAVECKMGFRATDVIVEGEN